MIFTHRRRNGRARRKVSGSIPSVRRYFKPRCAPLESRLVPFKSWLTLEPNHETITATAMPFLRDNVLAEINAQHAYEELFSGLTSAAHFDNCNFSQSAARINDFYQRAVSAADPAHFDSLGVADWFGKLLHPVQDFYSHSNWVDDGQSTLIDSNDGPWDPLAAYSIHDGAMILQGHNPEPFGPGSLRRNGFVVTVRVDGQEYNGVLTGTFGFSDECPTNVAVPHGSPISQHGLNKDSPSSYDGALYEPAALLAVVQTEHEFARLLTLVEQAYGTADHLVNAWVMGGSSVAGSSRELFRKPRMPTRLAPELSLDELDRLYAPKFASWAQRLDATQLPLLEVLKSGDRAARRQLVDLLHNQAHAPVDEAAVALTGLSIHHLATGMTNAPLLSGHAGMFTGTHDGTGSTGAHAGNFALMAMTLPDHLGGMLVKQVTWHKPG